MGNLNEDSNLLGPTLCPNFVDEKSIKPIYPILTNISLVSVG